MHCRTCPLSFLLSLLYGRSDPSGPCVLCRNFRNMPRHGSNSVSRVGGEGQDTGQEIIGVGHRVFKAKCTSTWGACPQQVLFFPFSLPLSSYVSSRRVVHSAKGCGPQQIHTHAHTRTHTGAAECCKMTTAMQWVMLPVCGSVEAASAPLSTAYALHAMRPNTIQMGLLFFYVSSFMFLVPL